MFFYEMLQSEFEHSIMGKGEAKGEGAGGIRSRAGRRRRRRARRRRQRNLHRHHHTSHHTSHGTSETYPPVAYTLDEQAAMNKKMAKTMFIYGLLIAAVGIIMAIVAGT